MSYDRPAPNYSENNNERWYDCVMCGFLHPLSNLTKYKGKWYCLAHYNFRFRNQFRDEVKIKLKDNLDET